MVGPLLIFDKSFLQMLNPEEVFELSLHFFLVGTPTLIREIIGDLKKKPDSRRLPEDVVKALAAKMGTAHGIQPADFHKLAIGNLCGADVPMLGQVPVDPSAPNVSVSRDGKGLLYDSVPEQRIWDRWASGDFTTDDEQIATAWRNGLENVDLRAVGDRWKEFARQHFGSARNLAELIMRVDGLLSDPKPDIQLEVLGITLSFLRAPTPVKNPVFKLLLDQPGCLAKDLAPYASSIVRLYLTFVGGLARGFIGPRPSHYIDLQYLFYAPFCMVFVSGDRFHREMWGATSGINTFAWGQDLKNDLASRVTVRKQMTAEERRAKAKEYGFYPFEVEGSVITDVWRRYMRPKEQVLRPTQAKTIEHLEPDTREMIKNAMKEFDRR